jgi:futalosine hydrolase
MSIIALLAPTPLESKGIRSKIQPSPGKEMKILSRGDLHGITVFFTHCGAGKVNAAHSATLLLENHDIERLILFGIGGAYEQSGLDIGDIAIAETENYGDEGIITSNGWKPMDFIGIPLLKKEKEYYNSYKMDSKLCLQAVIASKICGFNVRSGNFITVSMCSGTQLAGECLRTRFNGLCENMEGAAVAHICTMYDIPMVEIRGISNIIDERDINRWNIEKAAANCNKTVLELIRRLGQK